MHLGDMKKTEYSHLHREEVQKCTVVVNVRFCSMSIYGLPRFGTRESGGIKFFESLLHPRHQDRSSTWVSSFHPPHSARTHNSLFLKHKHWRG